MNEPPIRTFTKLIEVALPLEKINEAASREKSIRHGHPSTLHLWWARRPLAAARAVIFSQMVDDPSTHPERFPTEEAQVAERERLFRIIEELVLWESTTNEVVLERARAEIRRSWRDTCEANRDHPQAAELFNPEKLPGFHDPFAGGGALPLEAQRLGLEAHASDLNPVAVLINKAMIEIPPRFAGMAPVNPESREKDGGELIGKEWKGAAGLAEDIRYYGRWMRDRARERIGHLYPKVKITEAMVAERPDLKPYLNRELTVIAWLWARTVHSPNPAFADIPVPLVSTFMLSTKKGKEVYVQPVIEERGYRFTVKVGEPPDLEAAKMGTKLSRGANFRCVMSGTPMEGDYIKTEGKAGRMGVRLMAIVCDGDRRRVYLDPLPEHEVIARTTVPTWKPEVEISGSTQYLGVKPYGMYRFDQLFTPRQIVVLTTFGDYVAEAMEQVKKDGIAAGLQDDHVALESGGRGARAYGEAVEVYLGTFLSRLIDLNNSLCQWRNDPAKEHVGHLFSRQAIPMVWDYAEANPVGSSAGGFDKTFVFLPKLFPFLLASPHGHSIHEDAQTQLTSLNRVVSTDPPYYDNVPYADLSDFFYLWLRRSLRTVFPQLLTTITVPKAEELTAFAYRHNGKDRAESFFLEGMTKAMRQIVLHSHVSFPVTVYYAFKQAEKTEKGIASTGWETFLEALIESGFALTGTWPMRTELANRMRGMDSNALASSIVLVCRRRPDDAPVTTRGRFIDELREEMTQAVKQLLEANTPPVDMQQAAIGPGMAVYSRYREVREAAGVMSVHDALVLINETLDEILGHAESDLDTHSRWAVAWFDQFGFQEGEYGIAETMASAKVVSVKAMVEAGFLSARGGQVRLLRRDEMRSDWTPLTDKHFTIWEAVQHMVRVLADTGEEGAARLYAELTGTQRDGARELCYRLFNTCERRKWSDEALGYNRLIAAWPSISLKAQARPAAAREQELF
jgi:putative DNA methylase